MTTHWLRWILVAAAVVAIVAVLGVIVWYARGISRGDVR